MSDDLLGLLNDVPGLPEVSLGAPAASGQASDWRALSVFATTAGVAEQVQRVSNTEGAPATVARSLALLYLIDGIVLPLTVAAFAGRETWTGPVWVRRGEAAAVVTGLAVSGLQPERSAGCTMDTGLEETARTIRSLFGPVIDAFEGAVGMSAERGWGLLADEVASHALVEAGRRGADREVAWDRVGRLLDVLQAAGAPLGARPQREVHDEVADVGDLVVRSTCCGMLSVLGAEQACTACPSRSPQSRGELFRAWATAQRL